MTFPAIEKHMSHIIELFTTRNIILHNNGIVNMTYLNINKTSKLSLGEKRVVNRDYLKLTFVLLVIIGKSINEQIVNKVNTASS